MLEAKLANAGLLKKIVESIKDLVTDAPFEFSETGVSLLAMDSSHVAIVSLKLEVGFFDKYNCDRTINLGISLGKLLNHLQFGEKDDTCIIKYDQNDSIDSIVFKLINLRNEKTTEMVIKMIDITAEDLEIPQIQYSVVCEMNAGEFQKLCRNMLTISCDTLNITADKASIRFTGNGDSGSSVVTYLPSQNIDDENDGVCLEVRQPVNVNFSLKYLSQFSKASLSDRVRLSLSNDTPIVVEYSIQQSGYLKFCLAPRIDEDDNMT